MSDDPRGTSNVVRNPAGGDPGPRRTDCPLCGATVKHLADHLPECDER